MVQKELFTCPDCKAPREVESAQCVLIGGKLTPLRCEECAAAQNEIDEAEDEAPCGMYARANSEDQ
jgi:hypothetical protein